MTVDAIKEAIARLPQSERHTLSGWLNELNLNEVNPNELDYDTWDSEMAADFSPGGLGMALVDRVKCDIAEREAVPFEHGRKQAQAESTDLRA